MISVSHLYKRYDDVEALRGISFDIQKGEFYGLLGPNGAGKTTTISILSTILPASEGAIQIAGLDLNENSFRCKKLIGVVPQEIALYNEMSAYDNLMFWGGLYDVPKATLRKRIDETLKLFGLFDRRRDKVKDYSGGMKRRINIASALLHDPKILFMDEPTVGIDPQSRNLIFEVVKHLHEQGMTIVYTTHYMEEAERFCDRIGIIDNGQIIAQGSLEELKTQSNIKEAINVGFTQLSDLGFEELSTTWPDLKRVGNSVLFFTSDIRRDLSVIILNCNTAGLDITHIEIQSVNLETIFLKLTGKQLRD